MGPELDLRPQLERLDRLICWSEDIDEGALTFAFRPLWQLDEPGKAALALSRAQATQVYAGLKLWPDTVMAKLAEAQLVADGTYPNAAAVFAETQATTSTGPSATLDYDPAQPRAPDGRWTSGAGGRSASAATKTASRDPASGTSPAGTPAPTAASPDYPDDVPRGWHQAVAAAVGALDPVGTASAHEASAPAIPPQRTDPASAHEEADPAIKILARTTALLYSAWRLQQSAIQAVKGFTGHLAGWLPGGSAPDCTPAANPEKGREFGGPADPSPPPLTIHGETGSAALPGFSPAPPAPGLPPSVAVPPVGRSDLPGASVPTAGNPNSLSQQAEDPEEKAQQEKIRKELERDFDNIKQHITDKDAFAAWEESRGNHLWTKGDGTPYKHEKEVSEAQEGLRDIILRAKGLLGRPRLLPSEAGPLQDLLGRASRALDRTEDYLPRGGQGTGDGWVLIPPQAHDLRTFPR